MKIRRFSSCLALMILTFILQCSEARHSIYRRAYNTYDDIEFDEEEDPPAAIVSRPENFSVNVGSRVKLKCKISPPEAAIWKVIIWAKNESETLFLNTIRTTFQNNYELVSKDLIINDVNVDDTGSYTCTILQEVKVSVTHRVIVNVPPMIVSFTVTDNEPVEGTAVLFTCQTSGVPKPTIQWSRLRSGRNFTDFLSEANGEFNNQTFYIPHVTENDSGVYYCYAVNDAGNFTAPAISLKVLGKPQIHAHMSIIHSDIDEEAVLKCSTHDGPHEIRWYKDGTRIQNGANFVVKQTEYTTSSVSTLTVTPKKNEDFGTFSCEAANRAGINSKSIQLTERTEDQLAPTKSRSYSYRILQRDEKCRFILLYSLTVLLKKLGASLDSV
ncbi:immunoglobulin i-set domain-containing protein [Phthorimaea operculella]|nr:immunoglobulin i-set domain-containing protein [Phthorimaea operculella]